MKVHPKQCNVHWLAMHPEGNISSKWKRMFTFAHLHKYVSHCKGNIFLFLRLLSHRELDTFVSFFFLFSLFFFLPLSCLPSSTRVSSERTVLNMIAALHSLFLLIWTWPCLSPMIDSDQWIRNTTTTVITDSASPYPLLVMSAQVLITVTQHKLVKWVTVKSNEKYRAINSRVKQAHLHSSHDEQWASTDACDVSGHRDASLN